MKAKPDDVVEMRRGERRLNLPLVALAVVALAIYGFVSQVDMSEMGRNALFDTVMVFVAIGIAGAFGWAGSLLRARSPEIEEWLCFVGALVGAIIFYVVISV